MTFGRIWSIWPDRLDNIILISGCVLIIATLLEKQEEIEILQEKITSQSLQLLELKEMNSQLVKDNEGKQ